MGDQQLEQLKGQFERNQDSLLPKVYDASPKKPVKKTSKGRRSTINPVERYNEDEFFEENFSSDSDSSDSEESESDEMVSSYTKKLLDNTFDLMPNLLTFPSKDNFTPTRVPLMATNGQIFNNQ